MRAAVVDPFFRLDRAPVTKTNLLHNRTEQAIDERSNEAAEGNCDCVRRWLTRDRSERPGGHPCNERRADGGRHEAYHGDAS